MDVPPAQFYKGSPMLEVLDFLEQLAPFTEPDLMLRDPRPILAAETLSAATIPKPSGTQPDRAESEHPVDAPSAYDLLRQSLGRP